MLNEKSGIDTEKILRLPPELQLDAAKAEIRQILDSEEREVAESQLIFSANAGSTPIKEHVVVLVHGINTYAVWQERLARKLTTISGITVYPIGYGRFDFLRFLCPFTRRFPINHVLEELRSIRIKHPTADISVVAHSFGTYIISKILSEESDIRLHRIQLCGSIIAHKFKWSKVASKISGLVVNDAGTNDYWPVVATMATWGYGATGTFGFKTCHVTDRFHKCGHSDFFNDHHLRKYWVPLIIDGYVKPSRWTAARSSPGWRISLLNVFPLKSLVGIGLALYAYRIFA